MSVREVILYVVILLAGLIVLAVEWIFVRPWLGSIITRNKLGPEAPILKVDGLSFRDLNKNGHLDIYEDHRRPIDERVEDLLGQMTLEEKVGLMMQPMINAGKDGKLIERPSFITPVTTSEMVVNRHIKHFNIVFSGDSEATATWHTTSRSWPSAPGWVSR